MKKIILTLILTLGFSQAHAVPTVFGYSGTCASVIFTSCSSIGLSVGDAVGGSITVDSSDIADGTILGSEVTSFLMTFGNVVFNSALGHTVQGFIAVPPAQFDPQDLRFVIPGGFSSPKANTGVLFGLSGWTVRQGFKVAAGSGEYSVPEPGTLGLLGLGLLGLGIARRTRKG